MTQVVINNITSGYNLSKFNNNFINLAAWANNVALSNAGGNNVMHQDFDLNSNDLLNVGLMNAQGILLNGQPVSITNLGALGPNSVGTSNVIDSSITDNKINNVSSAKAFFSQSGASSLVRSVQDKLRELNPSVLDYVGVDPTGITDSTAGLQAAINANAGRSLYFPPGNYKITSPLTILNGLVLYAKPETVNILLGTANMDGIIIGDGTVAGANSSGRTSIIGLAFNPAPGVGTSSSKSAIFVNYSFFIRLEDIDVYGSDSGNTTRLYNGITLFQTTTWYINNYHCTNVVNYGLSTGGSPGIANRTVDGYVEKAEFTNCGNDCVFIGPYSAGLVLNTITAQMYNQWGIHIQMNPVGPSGQNIFILQPDLEADGASSGIWVEYGSTVQIIGGWISGSKNSSKAVFFDTNTDTCSLVGCDIVFGQVTVSGLANSVRSCNITGDAVTTPVGIVVNGTAADTQIIGCRVRQFTNYGIQFIGSPLRCLVDGCHFKQNTLGEVFGQNFAGPGIIPPTISGCQSDASPALTAAASVTLHVGRNIYQVTGTTNINTMTALGANQRITLQAAAGGCNFVSGGNLQLKTSPTAVPAFSTISFVCDGVTWFEDGRNF